MVKTTKFTKNDLWKDGEDDGPIPLVPAEKIPNKLSMDLNAFENSLKNPVYIGIHLKYSVNNSDFDTIGKIWKFTKDSWSIEEYWVDEPE